MALRWYSVSVLSNFEKRVAESIRHQVEQDGLEEQISEVLVPTEDVIEVRRGKKVQTERRFMPGYVLVRMEMTDKAYHLVANTNRVTGFLGPKGKPTPMRDAEVNQILNKVEEGAERPRPMIHFEVGEQVKVTDGPFRWIYGLRRRGGRRECPPQSDRVDLWPGNPGRVGIRAGREKAKLRLAGVLSFRDAIVGGKGHACSEPDHAIALRGTRPDGAGAKEGHSWPRKLQGTMKLQVPAG